MSAAQKPAQIPMLGDVSQIKDKIGIRRASTRPQWYGATAGSLQEALNWVNADPPQGAGEFIFTLLKDSGEIEFAVYM